MGVTSLSITSQTMAIKPHCLSMHFFFLILFIYDRPSGFIDIIHECFFLFHNQRDLMVVVDYQIERGRSAHINDFILTQIFFQIYLSTRTLAPPHLHPSTKPQPPRCCLGTLVPPPVGRGVTWIIYFVVHLPFSKPIFQLPFSKPLHFRPLL